MGPRHRKQRSVVVKAESMDHSGVCPPDVQQVLVIKEEVPVEQDEWDPSLDHDDSNPLYIKEEEEEFCISQEGEPHDGLEEDNSMFPFTPLTSGHNEAIPRFSQLHQSRSSKHMREGGPQASCSTKDIKTEANWVDCHESEPDDHLNQDGCLNLGPGNKPIYISETESDDDDETRKRTRKSQSPFWEKNGIPIYKVTMMPLSQLQPLVSGKGRGPHHISSPGLSADVSRQNFARAGVPNVTHLQPLVSGKPKASHQIGSPGFSADFTGQTVTVQRAGVFKPSHIAGSSVTPGSAVTPQNLQPVGWLYGDPVYAIGAGGFTPPYSAALPKNASMSVKQSPESKRKKEDKPYIKKPPNSFMLFMKEQRQNIVAECNVKESATVNQILGMKWKSMSDEEQAKYYELAHKERILHSQMYPDWSPSDNYAKKKKRTRVKPVYAMEALGEDPSQPKRLCVLPGPEDTLQPQTVVFMPSTQTAALKPQPQTVVLQPTTQSSAVKPKPQTLVLQPSAQTSVLKQQPQPIVLEPTAQNAAGKTKPQTLVLQPSTQTAALKPQPQTVVLQQTVQNAAVKPQPQTVLLQPTTQNATEKPQTGMLQPTTQNATEKPHTGMLQPTTQNATVKSQTGMLQPTTQNATAKSQTVMLQPTTQNATAKPQTGLLQPTTQNPTAKPQTGMLQPTTQNATAKPQTGLLQPTMQNATAKPQTGMLQLTTQNATEKPQTGLLQPTMQNATAKPQTGLLQPTTQNATAKPQTGMWQPTMQTATVNPQPQTGILQPAMQNAPVKPQPQTVVLQPTAQNASVKPEPQTIVLEPTTQNASVKPKPQAVVFQPSAQTAALKPPPQPIVFQPAAQNAAGKPKPQTFVLQPTAQTVAGNPQTQSAAVKPQMQSVAINPHTHTPGVNPHTHTPGVNPHTQTAGVKPQTQTVVLQPHTQTVVLQPHTQTVVLQHQTSASTTAMLQTNGIIPQPQQRQIEQKPYIKKPPNAFMLFMREQRPNVVAQYNMKESATVNQILGQKWNALTREEQAKYFELARQEKIIHSQLYPDWSPNANPKRKRRVRAEIYSGTEVPVPAFAEESSQPKMPSVLSGSDRMPHTQTVVIEPHTQALVFKPHTQAVVLKLGTQSVVMQPHNVSTQKQANVNQATAASTVDSIETRS